MCKLLILELDLTENDSDSVELIRLELDDVIKANYGGAKKLILSCFGSKQTVLPLLNEYLQKCSMGRQDILYFGITPYSQDEITTTYGLVSIREGAKGFECHALKTGAKYSWGIGMPYNVGLQIFRQLKNISRLSIEGDSIDIRTAINQAIEVISEAPSELLRAALKSAIDQAKKLIELEINFFCGNETRTLGAVASASYLQELISNNLSVIETGYSSKDLVGLKLPALQFRLDFIRAGIELRRTFHKSVASQEMPRLFLWFSTYFLKLAQFYANRLQYPAALGLSMRALEVYCQGVLIKEGDGDFDSNGKFLINGKKSSGFADAWGAVQNHRFCEDETLATLIWRAIEIRNGSIFGHGVTHSNSDLLEQLNAAITKVIKNYELKHAPLPVLWDPLRKQINSNIFQEIDRSIASQALNLLSVIPTEV